MLVVPETVKLKRSDEKPKAASRWTGGFQHRVGRPPKEDGQVEEHWISWVDPKVPTPDFHTPSAFGLMKMK